MSSGKDGFTEDDQARIAEEVQGRVSARRAGLGFGGTNFSSQDASKSSTSVSWFHQNSPESDTFKNTKSDHDTTQGAFPWDGGQRGNKVGGVARKNIAAKIPPPGEALSASGPCRVREFPLIRDRDIERTKGVREGKRSRSRSVSRDRERKSRGCDREHRRRRDRSRSGSRERGRGSWREVPHQAERERGRQHQRDRGRDRDRVRERDRTMDRTRDKDKGIERDAWRLDRRSHSPARGPRDTPRKSHCDNTSDDGIGRRDGRHVLSSVDRKLPGKGSSSLPTAVDTKVAIKRRLQKVAAADASLKTGFTALVGGGAGWERVEMSTASDFFKSDEVAAKGGVASVAPEYEARLAEILAVEDEETMCLGDGIRKNATSASAEWPAKSLDLSTRAHHDAIFARKGSDVSQPLSVSQSVATASPANAVTGRMTSNTGGMGAAARARLALTGKLGGTTMDEATPVLLKAIKKSPGQEDRQPNSQDHGDKPLFKTLRVGDAVEARYTVDDKWYKSVILQVIHGGFEIARYKVRYTEYGNEETLSWKRIRRLSSAPEVVSLKDLAESQPVAPTTSTPPESPHEHQDKAVSSDKLSEQFAGMRPRGVRIENKEGGESTEQDAQMGDEISVPAGGADVVNPNILSGGPGRKLSWKAKLKARKAAASATAGSTNNVQNLPKKQLSLVPDFAALKRERETDRVLDKSEWRAKVVFGIGGVKKKHS